MKRIALTSLVSIFCIGIMLAQTPQSFNYQTVLHGVEGNVLSNQSIVIKFSIVQNSSTNEIIYSETHSVTTNSLGLISLKIGEGTDVTGNFSTINWSLGQYSLKIELDLLDGSGFQVMGTSELVSVPYALHAQTATEIDDADADPNNEIQTLLVDGDSIEISQGNKVKLPGGSSNWQSSGNDIYYNSGKVGIGTVVPASKLVVKGDESTVTDDLLFAVVNNANDTVFAVFQGGVRINVDDNTSKAVGNKGGFAIGGFDSGKGTLTNEYLRITPDSIRFYVSENGTKAVGNKGGFAVGGFDSGKGLANEFLRVTGDSTRIYTKDNEAGFGVGNYGEGGVDNYLKLTSQNYFIGHEAGKNTVYGFYNSFIGYNAGLMNTGGDRNTFIGYYAGYSNIDGDKNIFIGDSAGYANETGFYNVFIGASNGTHNTIGSSNVFVGNKSGTHNTNGKWNVFLGHKTGHYNTTGISNVFIGTNSGYANTIGLENVFVGNATGMNNSQGTSNVMIGNVTGFLNTTGHSNVFIGDRSGYSNTTSSFNIFIGRSSGYNNTGGYNNLFIGDSAGYINTDGRYNIFIGNNAGYSNSTGNNNLFFGATTGENNSTGYNNTFLGGWCGAKNISGYRNVYIGWKSGWYNEVGSKNVFIGQYAGHFEMGSEKLYIENTDAGSTGALIYGEFDNDILLLNATVSVKESINAGDVINMKPLTSAPSNPVKGTMYFDDTLNKLRVWDGTVWQNCF
jgi:trimeric autotransporter adhesin